MQIPYFNAPIYLENKTQIGKVEEILGPIHKYVRRHLFVHARRCFPVTACVFIPCCMMQLFSVKTSEGVVATSFKKDDKVGYFGFGFLHYQVSYPVLLQVYINPQKLLPLERFLNPQSSRGGGAGGRGRGESVESSHGRF
jgi:H/ACA ribonucleoprotein complex subunit 1